MAGTEGAGDESLISNLFLRHNSGDVEEDFGPGPPACHGVWPDRQNADPWAGEL